MKWMVAAFVLPMAVTAFYLIFTDGQLVKNDTTGGKLFYLIDAICYTGIAPGICEEFIFRGLIMRTLERKWNKTVAVLAPSVLFALMHTLNMQLGFVDMLLLITAGTSVGVMFSLIALQSGTIWSGAAVHSVWNAIILGGVLTIESPANGMPVDFLYRYELNSTNILLTGGRFGIESSLPAIMGYCVVSAIAFMLLKKQADNQKNL